MKLILVIFFFFFSNQALSLGFVPENKEIIFDIYRKEKVIGKHEIFFNKNENILNIEINVDIKVKIGFITIYKYSHNNNETWENDELIKISTNSITNSKIKYNVYGQKNFENFEFIGIDGNKTTKKNIIPISYWNRDILDTNEFLDTQKGIIRKSEIKFLKDEIILFNNKEVNTEKYKLVIITKHHSDKKTIPEILLWYTKLGELMKLQFNSPEDNSIIDYVRIK